jgi:hypothetical protein
VNEKMETKETRGPNENNQPIRNTRSKSKAEELKKEKREFGYLGGSSKATKRTHERNG